MSSPWSVRALLHELYKRGRAALWRPALFATGALTLTSAASGCNSVGCTLIGCFSGLTVQLANPPAPPYRVEAFSTGGQARFVWRCPNDSGCGGAAFFPDFRPDRAFVEVITASDTVRYEVVGPIRYTENFPNGRQCGGACYTAQVTVGQR